MSDPHRFEFRDGQLWMLGRDGWREAVCAVCEEPIQWCLDMFSFTTGFPHALAHARCVWLPEEFGRELHRVESHREERGDD